MQCMPSDTSNYQFLNCWQNFHPTFTVFIPTSPVSVSRLHSFSHEWDSFCFFTSPFFAWSGARCLCLYIHFLYGVIVKLFLEIMATTKIQRTNCITQQFTLLEKCIQQKYRKPYSSRYKRNSKLYSSSPGERRRNSHRHSVRCILD